MSNPVPPSISLVVCTLGRIEPLRRLLRSLEAQHNKAFEVVVVDQNPAGFLDDTLNAHASTLAIRHIRSPKGLSRARNIGLQSCHGSVVGFPDDDCWYDADVTERVASFFQSSSASVLIGRTVDASGKESVSTHRATSGPVGRDDVFLSGNSNGLFARTGLAREIGFDETLGVGAPTPYQSGEETDFLLRCLAVEATIVYERSLTIRHDQSDPESAASAARARVYSAGYGRVLRIHGYGFGALAPRAARSLASAALSALRGDGAGARRRIAWAAGALRGYLTPVRTPPRDAVSRPAGEPKQRGTRGTTVREVLGIEFTPLSEPELVREMAEAPLPPGAGARAIYTANLDHVVQLGRDPGFRAAYNHAWAVTADGMPVYAYAKFRNAAAPSRIAGCELFASVMPALPPSWARCFFVAGSQQTAIRLTEYLLPRGFPSSAIAWDVPPFGFERDERYSADLAHRIKAHGTTHLFFGVGAPKSEIWSHVYGDRVGDCYILCCGIGLDFFAGTQRRAPVWMRRHGLEWLWRFLQEPRRLYRRYFLDSWSFLGAVIRDLASYRP